MNSFPVVVLKARKARPFFGRHPWVFEGAVEKVDPGVSPGSIVKVLSFEKEFIAYGLYNPNSKLRVRLYSWDKD
ncbi:MAG: class I SAM-dependent rRNA methyltransferase, partial [Planctomycetia bacterium]